MGDGTSGGVPKGGGEVRLLTESVSELDRKIMLELFIWLSQPASSCYWGINQVKSDSGRSVSSKVWRGGFRYLVECKKIWPTSDVIKLSDNQQIQKWIRKHKY